MKIEDENSSNKILQPRNILKKLQFNDPDPVIKKFCSIVYGEPLFYGIAKNVFEKRPLVEEEHLLFLVFISLQYLTNFSYDQIDVIEKRKVREDLKEYGKEIEDLCIKRNVSTNVPERYVGLQIINSMVYSKYQSPLRVVDIGCSFGLGLMALNTTFFEEHIAIDAQLLPYVRSKSPFSKIVGIDTQEPDLDWVLASYLPEAKEKRKSVKNTHNHLNKYGLEIEMFEGNALALEEIPQLSFGFADIIWISNTCYQIEGDIKDVIKGIEWLLKTDGLWLYAYYRHDIDKEITPKTNPYVVSAYINHKDWTKKLDKGLQEFRESGVEVLEAPHELVESIRPGRDYKKFVDLVGVCKSL